MFTHLHTQSILTPLLWVEIGGEHEAGQWTSKKQEFEFKQPYYDQEYKIQVVGTISSAVQQTYPSFREKKFTEQRNKTLLKLVS